MEAPTPVSALLHAGVVNIGGFVMIRLSPRMAHASIAQSILDDAARAQDAANVSESEDGDVEVPDKAAPKAKKKRPGKAKADKAATNGVNAS